MEPRRRSVDERADRLERRLDAVLAPRGYHLLHGAVWPGGQQATIDHVVIGPSGAWVIIERAVGARSSLTRVAAQARAVSTAIGGVHVGAILAVHDGDVPDGAFVHDGVTIAIAGVPTMDVIADATTRLGRAEIDRLVAVATTALRPLSVTAPTSADVPDTIPAWVLDEATPARRRWIAPLLVLVAAAAAAAAVYVLVRPGGAATPTTPPAPTSASPVAVTYECRHPGTGWTQVVTWPGLDAVHTVLTSPTLEGPWAPADHADGVAARDGVVPGEHSVVRVQYLAPSGGAMEANTEAQAPTTSC